MFMDAISIVSKALMHSIFVILQLKWKCKHISRSLCDKEAHDYIDSHGAFFRLTDNSTCLL